MINERQVLKIASRKLGIIFYKDFKELEPPHAKDSHWLRDVKKVLINSGYQCHERRYRWKWDCSYTGSYTHFHKT